MPLVVPSRRTLRLDIQKSINDEIVKHFDPKLDLQSSDEHVKFNNDIAALDKLRSQVEEMSNNTAKEGEAKDFTAVRIFTEYVSRLMSLADVTDLESIAFPWSNSLSYSCTMIQGPSVWFEITNVIFNLAAHYTQIAANSPAKEGVVLYRKAAGVFEYTSNALLLQLKALPPPELSSQTLLFLARACLVEAADLEAKSPTEKWSVSLHYDDLVKKTPEYIPEMVDGWKPRFSMRSRELACESCMILAESLHRSRRQADRELEKGVLLRCIELSTTNETRAHAEEMMNEPLTRRGETSLATMEEVVAFTPSHYFSLQADNPLQAKVPFDVTTSQQFNYLLPAYAANIPFICQQKFEQTVDALVLSKLFELNHRTRLAFVATTMPVAIELSSRPTSVPQSLVEILKQFATQNNELPLQTKLQICQAKADECSALLTHVRQNATTKTTLTPRVAELRESITHISKRTEQFQHLFEFVSRCCKLREQEEALTDLLGEFIGITKPKQPTKPKSKSMFLTKAESTREKINGRLSQRDAKRKDIETRMRKVNFKEMVKEAAVSGSKLTQNEVDALVKTAMKSFAADLEYVEVEAKAAESHLRAINDLFACYNKQNARSQLPNEEITRRKRAVQSIMWALAKWCDIDYDLHRFSQLLQIIHLCLTVNISPEPIIQHSSLEAQTSRQQNRVAQRRCSESHNVKSAFSWRPGTPIDIRINPA